MNQLYRLVELCNCAIFNYENIYTIEKYGLIETALHHVDKPALSIEHPRIWEIVEGLRVLANQSGEEFSELRVEENLLNFIEEY